MVAPSGYYSAILCCPEAKPSSPLHYSFCWFGGVTTAFVGLAGATAAFVGLAGATAAFVGSAGVTCSGLGLGWVANNSSSKHGVWIYS